MFGIDGLRELYVHMDWADGKVWQAIASLSVPDTTLHDRLYHSHFTQRGFLQVWTGQPVPRYDPKSMATLGEIRDWARPLYREAAAFLDSLKESDLSRPTAPPWVRLYAKTLGRQPAITTLGETMFQVTSHTTYHRGQINTRVRELGGEPPLVDYIAWLWHGRPAPEWPAV